MTPKEVDVRGGDAIGSYSRAVTDIQGYTTYISSVKTSSQDVLSGRKRSQCLEIAVIQYDEN